MSLFIAFSALCFYTKIDGGDVVDEIVFTSLRVLVFVFVRLVRHAGSATSVARNAHFLGTIVDRSVGLVDCSRLICGTYEAPPSPAHATPPARITPLVRATPPCLIPPLLIHLHPLCPLCLSRLTPTKCNLA